MERSGETWALIAGCDAISRSLQLCLCPFGWLYRFETTPNGTRRPKPLPLILILTSLLSFLPGLVWFMYGRVESSFIEKYTFSQIQESRFLMGFYPAVEFFHMALHLAILLILIGQHGAISNVLVHSNHIVPENEQIGLGKSRFVWFFIMTITSNITFCLLSSSLRGDISISTKIKLFLLCQVEFFINMLVISPLMYICYLGSVLGRHVKNFSKIHIDTMFDQFMKAIEVKDELELRSNVNDTGEQEESKKTFFYSLGQYLKVFRSSVHLVIARLRMTQYPELPEMKMTRLSSTKDLKITDAMKIANSQLIRSRLRKTQLMLSELRDVVNDINKISSPVTMLHLVYQTTIVVLVTTASIHLKVYRSINLLIIPTFLSVIGLLILVVVVCTSLDDVTRELKLMINKVFDFIIMNHGSSSSSIRSKLSSSTESEEENLSETWSQFQYTRKLANTIHLTTGGILPVSRRLVLSILGHALSAVFISIEIMSIIDSSQSHVPVHRVTDKEHLNAQL